MIERKEHVKPMRLRESSERTLFMEWVRLTELLDESVEFVSLSSGDVPKSNFVLECGATIRRFFTNVYGTIVRARLKGRSIDTSRRICWASNYVKFGEIPKSHC